MAINRLLEENPEWRGKLIFSFIGITNDIGYDYFGSLSDIRVLINKINYKFGKYGVDGNIIYFEEIVHRNLNLFKRLAFFVSSHVLMITAIRLIY